FKKSIIFSVQSIFKIKTINVEINKKEEYIKNLFLSFLNLIKFFKGSSPFSKFIEMGKLLLNDICSC
ncbi:hypothetical protein JIY74_37530, partial [Vibrio harveyi]|nr:hypothetical protein [Vibrio harveyi]